MQITTPAPHHSVFCRPDDLPNALPASCRCRIMLFYQQFCLLLSFLYCWVQERQFLFYLLLKLAPVSLLSLLQNSTELCCSICSDLVIHCSVCSSQCRTRFLNREHSNTKISSSAAAHYLVLFCQLTLTVTYIYFLFPIIFSQELILIKC